MVKKVTSLLLCIALCVAMVIPAFAAEVVSDTDDSEAVNGTLVPEATSDEAVSPRTISGYGQATNLTSGSGKFYVPVTISGNANGFGLTIKTDGSGTANVMVRKPNSNTYLKLNPWSLDNPYAWEMTNTDEKQRNFTGIQNGTYIVEYTVFGGPMGIYCHIYG